MDRHGLGVFSWHGIPTSHQGFNGGEGGFGAQQCTLRYIRAKMGTGGDTECETPTLPVYRYFNTLGRTLPGGRVRGCAARGGVLLSLRIRKVRLCCCSGSEERARNDHQYHHHHRHHNSTASSPGRRRRGVSQLASLFQCSPPPRHFIKEPLSPFV